MEIGKCLICRGPRLQNSMSDVEFDAIFGRIQGGCSIWERSLMRTCDIRCTRARWC
jgi:hypothetical protein